MFLGEIFWALSLIPSSLLPSSSSGAPAIPKLAKNLGSAKSEFEKGLKEGKNDGRHGRQADDAGRDQGARQRELAGRAARPWREPDRRMPLGTLRYFRSPTEFRALATSHDGYFE